MRQRLTGIAGLSLLFTLCLLTACGVGARLTSPASAQVPTLPAAPSAATYVLAVLSKLHPALWFPALLRRAGLGAALPGAALGLVLVGIYYTPTSLA